MISQAELDAARARAAGYLDRAGIVLSSAEHGQIEVADFGLGELDQTGLELVVYINTERCCAKELVMFPGQTCPEHWHPPLADDPGKEETFRCRWGEVYLFVPGVATPDPHGAPPSDSAAHYTLQHEVVLKPGDQYTIMPNTPHWFQAGPDGAVVSEFSTKSRDESDVFRDPRIKRETRVID
ncbi:MAG: D-lyxose/D-mannose family sugar isomerase [Armatimonadetes bacterium]|nr:D-lyxose/D-mannose family sugar isomerase [Armatimonadota bacterium]MDE2207448.1 D-lyxose/D-mannose family sugar isomerase [Armatimonadota bacterium]